MDREARWATVHGVAGVGHNSVTAAAAAKFASVVSDSVRPHRRQPTRLPRPWDSPGKNTRMGCHFLLQCMKVKSESEVAQSCLTLHDPMDRSPPGSSVHGIFQARELEWGAIASSNLVTTQQQSVLLCWGLSRVWKSFHFCLTRDDRESFMKQSET